MFGFWGNLFNISVNTQAVSVKANFHGLWSLTDFTDAAAMGASMVALHLLPATHYSIVYAIAFVFVVVAFKYLLPHNSGNSNQTIFAKPDSAIL